MVVFNIYLLINLFSLFLSLIFLGWMIFAVASIMKGAPFIRSKDAAIKAMLDLSKIKEGERSIDIGAGNGRIVYAFARHGAQAHGLEINGFLVIWSKLYGLVQGLRGKAFFHWGNLWQYDFSSYDVVSVYGIVQIMPDLEKKLRSEMRPGSRIVSNTFRFPNLPIAAERDGVYLYII